MTFTLRPYQQEAVEAVEGEFEPASDSADATASVRQVATEMEFE